MTGYYRDKNHTQIEISGEHKMCCFIRDNAFFYLLIYSVNFIQIILGKELFEFSQPSKCKSNEYFDTISLSCTLCDSDKNLKPSVDRKYKINFSNVLYKY